ncbi:hypothetical protein NPIL_702691 [Nephila pilipes]|uniref:Uncharacterized protein n=1 Tax=Nephila pilipes TaxID=299642 RepID=A0A8X6TAT8_NEPPI|nr:hypothetical protein NPIL_702691 [Nephila pilipes]
MRRPFLMRTLCTTRDLTPSDDKDRWPRQVSVFVFFLSAPPYRDRCNPCLVAFIAAVYQEVPILFLESFSFFPKDASMNQDITLSRTFEKLIVLIG